jgi:soluble lytic murein transglycosylase
MMQPVDSGAADAGPTFNGEHHEGVLHVLSAADHALYERAFDAADSGDWTGAKGLADQGHDPAARRLIQWRYVLDQNSGASFAEIDQFIKNNPDWPARDTLLARAEEAMDPTMDPHAVIAWFAGHDPVTGIGKIRLGEALAVTGSTVKGRALIRDGWINGSFDPSTELQIIQNHGDILTPDADDQRIANLLWNGDVTSARRELSRVDAATQAIASARITAQTTSSSRAGAGLSDNGLLFDRARAARRSGQYDTAETLLKQVNSSVAARANENGWWQELNIDTREAIKSGDYQRAYDLVSDNGMSAGPNYADAEFLAGWLALRFLKEPRTALSHFQKETAAVGRPISLARGHYWQGRAYEDLGDLASAYREYRTSSQYPETFYGQLALAKIDSTPTLHLRDAVVDAAAAKAGFDSDDLIPAIKVLGDLGEVSTLRIFALRDLELHPGTGHVKLLAQLLTDMGFRDIALRVAKTSAFSDTPQIAYTHPMIALPAYPGPSAAPEAAFVLGIIRQETEFDQYAVSGAGAVGIMQLLPSSARQDASSAGMQFRSGDLVSDQDYNLKIGMVELGNDFSDYGGSYILAAAEYNAGPGNVSKWLGDYGDPRGGTDPIDWIEKIPYNETRNYVQRVIENMEVYRNRLAGRDLPLRIVQDLSKVPAASMKPLAYTPKPGEGTSAAPAGVPTPAPRPGAATGTDTDASR